METTSSSPLPMLPCLVIDPDEITEDGSTILLDSKGDCHNRNIQALASNMRFSLTWQAGWILASDPINLRTFLYNPHTSDRIELPRFEHKLPRNFECALSDKPSSCRCIVVVLHPDEAKFWYCHVGGDDEWIKYDYDVGSQKYDREGLIWKKIVISHLTTCKGRFFFNISITNMASSSSARTQSSA